MRQFSSAFTEAKNQIEGRRVYAQLVEIEVNANSTAYFTSHPDTLTWNAKVYRPIPMRISADEQVADGTLPRMTIDVSNLGGEAFRFAKDNELVLNDVWIRFVNTELTTSGNDRRIKLQVLGAGFAEEIGQFTLGPSTSYDAEGPLRVYNRRDHPGIPSNFRNYFVIG